MTNQTVYTVRFADVESLAEKLHFSLLKRSYDRFALSSDMDINICHFFPDNPYGYIQALEWLEPFYKKDLFLEKEIKQADNALRVSFDGNFQFEQLLSLAHMQDYAVLTDETEPTFFLLFDKDQFLQNQSNYNCLVFFHDQKGYRDACYFLGKDIIE